MSTAFPQFPVTQFVVEWKGRDERANTLKKLKILCSKKSSAKQKEVQSSPSLVYKIRRR
jgi:hypothetical protein